MNQTRVLLKITTRIGEPWLYLKHKGTQLFTKGECMPSLLVLLHTGMVDLANAASCSIAIAMLHTAQHSIWHSTGTGHVMYVHLSPCKNARHLWHLPLFCVCAVRLLACPG